MIGPEASLWRRMFGPGQGFEGGLFLPDHKAATARRPIETLSADRPLRVPLCAMARLPTELIVRVGQRVRRGQALARPLTDESVAVAAPTSGTVRAFERAFTALDGFVPGVVLEPDGRDEEEPPSRAWLGASPVDELSAAGVVCPRPRGSGHGVLSAAARAGVTEVVVNGLETEPYLAADLRALVESSARIIDAAEELAGAIRARGVLLAIAYRHQRLLRRLRRETAGGPVKVAALHEKYPQCDPVVLVKTLLDREVPPGGDPLDVGVWVAPLAMVRMAGEAFIDGRPVTHALVTVSGDAIERPGVYRVPVGMPLRAVAERTGLGPSATWAMAGGPLTGVPVGRSDAVTTVETNALLVFRQRADEPPVPCIHCGWCVEHCPVGIDPFALSKLEGWLPEDDLTGLHLRACVECGLCSHICPSRLPLAETIRRMRRELVPGALPADRGDGLEV